MEPTREQIEAWRAESDGKMFDHRTLRHWQTVALCDLALQALDQAADARLGAAVRSVLSDLGYDHQAVRTLLEEDVYGETMVSCLLLAIERSLRSESAKGGSDG